MSTSTPLVIPALDNTFGCMLIGVLISSALWGICCVQAYYYYGRYWEDRLPIKLGVAFVVLLDTIHQALIGHTIYSYVITNFFNPLYLDTLVWSLGLQVLFCGMTAFFVQSFFTYRVFRLTDENLPVTAVLVSLTVGGFVLSVVYVATALRIPTITQAAVALKPLSVAVNAVGAATDILIAVGLCWKLQGSRTGFEKTDNMVSRLMLYAINTGSLTAGCAVCSLALILSHPNSLLYVPFYFTVGRLYSNSMLATLNARKSFKNGLVGRENLDMTAGSVAARRKSLAIGGLNREKPSVSIHVDTSMRRQVDTISMDIHELEYELDQTASPISARSSTIMDSEDFKKDRVLAASPV